MKRIVTILAAFALVVSSCQKYDAEIAELQKKIDALTTSSSKVNDNVAALRKIVEAIQAADQVTSFAPVSEGGKVVGYTVTFKEAGSVTVYNSTANVSVGVLDGKYYWMVNGAWLTDAQGNKIEAAAGSVVPQFRITSGNIEVSLDNGATWSNVGQIGTPVINNVVDAEGSVTFVMADGSSIVLPKQEALTLTLTTTSLSMAKGGGRSVNYTISGGGAGTQLSVYAKDGWIASVTRTSDTKGYIDVSAPSVASTSEVLVFLSDGNGRAGVYSIAVSCN